MKRSGYRALYMLLVAIVFSCLACKQGQSPSAMVQLRIVDTHFMGLLPLYVADEKGFFRDNGIAVKWVDVRDPGQASRAFFAGDADLLMTTFANILPAEAKQSGSVRLLLPAFESSDAPGSYILVQRDSPIRNLADLRGKTLGTYSGPSQKAYALIFLRKLGYVEPRDVRLVQVGTSAQVQSLFAGAFDALFAVEPHGSVAISQGARVVEEGVRTKYISNPFWVGSAALHPSFYDRNPSASNNIAEALAQAVEFIGSNESQAREILTRHASMTPEVAAKCRLYRWVARPNDSQFAEMQAHADLLHKEGLVSKRVQLAPLFVSLD